MNLVPKRPARDSAPLSFAQRQIWLMDRISPGNPAYGTPIAYRLTGQLDVPALERSVNELIRRHEVLRTTFAIVDAEPRQIIHPTCTVKLTIVPLDRLSSEDREQRARELATEEARFRWNLADLPLIRVLVFKLSSNEHILLVNVHHILGDGISLQLMLSELDKHYRRFTENGQNSLPDLAIQYADFAAWEQQCAAGKDYSREIEFWTQHLTGPVPVLELPADLPRPLSQSFNGSNIFFEIPNTVVRELAALGAREGCTAFVTLLAAFQVLLQRYSHGEEVLLGTPVSMRAPIGTEPLIGNFLNVIPLRCDLSGNPTFLEILRRSRRTTLRAFGRASLPFEKIVENIRIHREASRNPIFQALMEVLPPAPSQIGDLHVEWFPFDLGFAQFDLSFHVLEHTRGYLCRFEYCTDLFKADTVQRLTLNFQELLSSIVEDPTQKIATIRLLSASEKKQLVAWNSTSRPYARERCLHELFEITAENKPHHVAIECGGISLTYGELNSRANRLARYLIASGVRTEDLVGIYLERSIDLVVGMLAVLKAGSAYVPLDPLFPPERLAYMIEDARISTILTQSELQEAFATEGKTIIRLDTDAAKVDAESARNPNLPLRSSSLAYTIYTSGSSGRPKGVMIEHRSLVNCLSSMQNEPGFDPADVLVAVTTASFDIAALEIFLPLISGGKLVIASRAQAMDGSSLTELLERSRATMLQATPVTWKMLIDVDWKPAPNFKMLCGGEALGRDLAEELLTRGGQLWNMYGPTETTIWSSVHRVRSAKGPVPIGPPIANTQFYVVSDHFEPVPIGVPGELLIGGDGLARGYRNRSELTSERFVTKQLAGSEERVYRTGDLAKFRSDGTIDFLGRRDFQVKVRGYRIELEEIEHVLAAHDSVKDAAVIAWDDQENEPRLVAYYVPLPGCTPADADLRKHLRRTLPEYMCPSLFIRLQSFPLTPNGKLDRKAFPCPEFSGTEVSPRRVSAQSALESEITEIWETMLNRPVGLDDDFFELGGYSLLAARMFVLIEKKLGVKLPLALLLQCPTVRSLATKIEQKTRPAYSTSLVPIRARGTKPALFLVHGAEGNVLLYKNLAECLGADQPVYGLQSSGLDGGEVSEGTIESIATKYLEEIRSVQPRGPYYLGGYCLGGTIALEIAQQLRRRGESVALLAMIETYNIKSVPPVSWPLALIQKIQNIYFHGRNILLSGGDLAFLLEKLKVEISRFKVHLDILCTRIGGRFRQRSGPSYLHLRIRDANHRMQLAYDPTPYDGRIALFRSATCFAGFNDPYYGWKPFAMLGISVVELQNYPHGSLNHPFVKAVAGALKNEIDEALKDPEMTIGSVVS